MVWTIGVMLIAFVSGPDPIKQRSDPMFPDGLKHDFGSVRFGTQCKHTFRLVNTGNTPLRIVSLRSS